MCQILNKNYKNKLKIKIQIINYNLYYKIFQNNKNPHKYLTNNNT